MFNLALTVYGHTIWIATCSSERKIKLAPIWLELSCKSVANLVPHLDEWTDKLQPNSFTLATFDERINSTTISRAFPSIEGKVASS